MSFAVVVLSFNHPQLTERCVRSVLRFSPNLILIHNGSRVEHVDYLKKQFPTIEHEILSANRGFSGGANFGLRQGFKRSAKVFFLTNDCELTEELKEPSRLGILAPLIWRRKVGNIDSLGGMIDLRTGIASHVRIENPVFRGDERFYVPGSAFWIDQESFEKLGGFREVLGTYWEDIELSLRAPAQQVTLGIDPQTRILHRVGKTCHKDAHYTSYLYQRNRFIVCWNHLTRGRLRFTLIYLKSMLRLMIRKIRAGQWESLRLLSRAVHDGWTMK